MMENALPMIRRCAAAQWRGLSDIQRAELTVTQALQHYRNAGPVETPIWSVATPSTFLTLVSVKRDVVLYD